MVPLFCSLCASGASTGLRARSVTRDRGLHWERISEGITSEQWIFSLAVHPVNPDVIYGASKNGVEKGSGEPEFQGTVVKSADGGETWSEIVNGLYRGNEFYSIIIDPVDHERLYLCSSSDGMFMSEDAGASWQAINDGLTDLDTGTYPAPNVATPVSVSTDWGVMVLGTRGSGVFKRYMEVLPPEDYSRVIIDSMATEDGRSDVGSEQMVYVHGSWEHDGSDFSDASILVDGVSYPTNATGWASIPVRGDHAGVTSWRVTGVEGAPGFLMPPEHPSMTWDRIKIVEGGVDRDEVAAGEAVAIWIRAKYELDGGAFEGSQGCVYVNGEPMSWSEEIEGWVAEWRSDDPGTVSFDITGMSDTQYGLEAFSDTVSPLHATWRAVEDEDTPPEEEELQEEPTEPEAPEQPEEPEQEEETSEAKGIPGFIHESITLALILVIVTLNIMRKQRSP